MPPRVSALMDHGRELLENIDSPHIESQLSHLTDRFDGLTDKSRSDWQRSVSSGFAAFLAFSNFLRTAAATAVARLSHHNSVCPSVRLSYRWISQKQCKLGSPNLHHRLPGRHWFQEP